MTESTSATRKMDNATRGEEQIKTTSNKSSRWTTQGNDNGSNDGSRNVLALAVARSGVGRRNYSGQGEEEDVAMAADGQMQQSTKSSKGNGRCNGDSNNNNGGDGDSNSNGNSNSTTATATTINNKWQKKKRRQWSWQQQLWQKWWQWQQKLWWQRRSCYSAPLKGRGDCCSDHRYQVSALTTTISAAAAWMPWLKYRRLDGLF